MLKRFGLVLMAGCSLSIMNGTYAEVNLNGFATIAGGRTLSDDDALNGYDDKFSFDSGSLVGLQAQSDLGDGLSATAQIIARGEDQWEAKFEWAFVGYRFNENIKLLVGRQRIPYYNFSDYLDVGYAYHWIRPPEEVYSLPFDSLDGIGALVTNSLGSVESTFHFLYGRTRDELTIGGAPARIDSSDQMSLAWSLTRDWFTLRLGYSQSDLMIDSQTIETIAASWVQAGFPQFSDPISITDDDNTWQFIEAGFTIDKDNLLVVVEYTETDLEGTPLTDKKEAYYGSLGYRVGTVMPHITFGYTENTPGNTSFLDVVPDGVSDGLDALKAGTRALFNGSKSENEYITVGTRWDFHPAAALKVEYTAFDDKLEDSTDSLVRFAISTVF